MRSPSLGRTSEALAYRLGTQVSRRMSRGRTRGPRLSLEARLLVGFVGLLVLLFVAVGCATVRDGASAEVQGPNLSVFGRISVRQVAKPLLLGSYQWNRGPGFAGWTESMVLRDNSGIRLFEVSSDDEGTVVQYQDKVRTVDSLGWLIQDRLGVDVTPATLASWLDNTHEGEPLPDKAFHQGIRVDVIERHGDERPAKIRLIQDETIVLMTVRRDIPKTPI